MTTQALTLLELRTCDPPPTYLPGTGKGAFELRQTNHDQWQTISLKGLYHCTHKHTNTSTGRLLEMVLAARLRIIWKQRYFKTGAHSSRYLSMSHEIKVPIEEALLPNNRLRNFHPTHPGELLDGRFKTIAKLGFGGGSTV